MASVNKDPRGRSPFWYACYTDSAGVRRRVSTEQTDRRIAEKVADAKQRAENERRKGTISTQRIVDLLNDTLRSAGLETIQSIALKTWLEDWLNGKRKISPATRMGYKQSFRLFLEFLGPRSNTPLDSVTERDINAFIDRLRDSGRSAGTVNKIVRYLSAPLEQARASGKIKYNPIAATETLEHRAMVKGKFSPDHVALLVAAATSIDWEGAILFGYGHAARLQDVANLRWSSLDAQNGVVRFTERKTGSVAVVGLHGDFLDWLMRQPSPEAPDAYVFPTLANQNGGGRRGLSEQFSSIVHLAGIHSKVLKAADGKGRRVRSLTFHSLRHTGASEIFNSEAIKEVQRRVTNHARGGMVDNYTHQDNALIKAAVELIPRLPKNERPS